MMDEYGLGAKQDFLSAIKHYERSAGQDNVRAMYHLGLMYLHGRGSEVDHQRAAIWFDMVRAYCLLLHAANRRLTCAVATSTVMSGHKTPTWPSGILAWADAHEWRRVPGGLQRGSDVLQGGAR